MDGYKRLEDRFEWICARIEQCSTSIRMRRVRRRLEGEYRDVLALLCTYRVSDTSPYVISDGENENTNANGNEPSPDDIEVDVQATESEVIVATEEHQEEEIVPAPPNTPVSQPSSDSRRLPVSKRSRVSFKRPNNLRRG